MMKMKRNKSKTTTIRATFPLWFSKTVRRFNSANPQIKTALYLLLPLPLSKYQLDKKFLRRDLRNCLKVLMKMIRIPLEKPWRLVNNTENKKLLPLSKQFKIDKAMLTLKRNYSMTLTPMLITSNHQINLKLPKMLLLLELLQIVRLLKSLVMEAMMKMIRNLFLNHLK